MRSVTRQNDGDPTATGVDGCQTISADRLHLDFSDLPAEQIVDGRPRAGASDLITIGGVTVGVWEHTVGTSRDVEADEVFVVLSGEATVTVEGGGTLELAPGVLGVLSAGARTTWQVRTPLRKIYLTPGTAAGPEDPDAGH